MLTWTQTESHFSLKVPPLLRVLYFAQFGNTMNVVHKLLRGVTKKCALPKARMLQGKTYPGESQSRLNPPGDGIYRDQEF
ncbi:hypothetical protein POVCU2_0008990 [Plasmodium ovale curtisi]|uniref:Uncharacterized protein n=1 Tax=Plasmodium ovale curtisi TaxID=864141 RepID=A0A1A8VNG2_PLAOA|nr:hypothetical protein POVCU2_0008990 [Plasmodium ovale curtisi]SBS82597.1 hypothetical protein POVCU1_008060 [Plasmodium ovale curtisi]